MYHTVALQRHQGYVRQCLLPAKRRSPEPSLKKTTFNCSPSCGDGDQCRCELHHLTHWLYKLPGVWHGRTPSVPPHIRLHDDTSFRFVARLFSKNIYLDKKEDYVLIENKVEPYYQMTKQKIIGIFCYHDTFKRRPAASLMQTHKLRRMRRRKDVVFAHTRAPAHAQTDSLDRRGLDGWCDRSIFAW